MSSARLNTEIKNLEKEVAENQNALDKATVTDIDGPEYRDAEDLSDRYEINIQKCAGLTCNWSGGYSFISSACTTARYELLSMGAGRMMLPRPVCMLSGLMTILYCRRLKWGCYFATRITTCCAHEYRGCTMWLVPEIRI